MYINVYQCNMSVTSPTFHLQLSIPNPSNPSRLRLLRPQGLFQALLRSRFVAATDGLVQLLGPERSEGAAGEFRGK